MHRQGWCVGSSSKLWLFQRMGVWSVKSECPWNPQSLSLCSFKRSSLKSYSWSQSSGQLLLCILTNLHLRHSIPQKKVFSAASGDRILSGSLSALEWWIHKHNFCKQLEQRCIRAKCKGRFLSERASCGSRVGTWKSNVIGVCRSQGECEVAAGIGFPAGI